MKRLTMLIVDDVEVNRVSLREIFCEEYDVVLAEDGLVAMEILESSSIDIVILDLFMPNLDGKSVLKRMKSDDRFKRIPVVVKTAIDEKTEEDVLEAGADDFIFSPCNPAVVKNRVNNIVHKYIYEHEIMQREIDRERHTSDVREAFIVRMSHELRTPINSILGIAGLLKEYENNPAKVREAAGKIKVQGEYMLSLLNDILDISAIDKEQIQIRKNVFQLSNIVSIVSEQFYNECRRKGIHFSFKLENVTHEFLIGDVVRIKQIWMNLLSNAYKYTQAGGSIITVFSEEPIDRDNVWFEFSVKDTGRGISKEYMDKIWEPYERGLSTEVSREMGYGLGLAITKSIVEMMNGSISVISEVGEGAVFTVRIPMKTAKEQLTPDRSFHSMRALIVGDEEVSCAYYKAILARLGINHVEIYEMDAALDELNASYQMGEGYHFCFVNWNTPKGEKLVKKIRKLLDKEKLVIIGTSYEAETVEKEMKRAGVNYVLSKPVFQSTIYNLMTEIYRGKTDDGDTRGIEKGYNFKGASVLIAEDNAVNAEILINYLEKVNLTCDWVTNGEEALKKYRKEPEKYAALLMDISMPIMDGYEAAKEIRKLENVNGRAIPIIAVTANAFASDIIQVYEAGMNAHVIKPVEMEVLYETLNQFLA